MRCTVCGAHALYLMSFPIDLAGPKILAGEKDMPMCSLHEDFFSDMAERTIAINTAGKGR